VFFTVFSWVGFALGSSDGDNDSIGCRFGDLVRKDCRRLGLVVTEEKGVGKYDGACGSPVGPLLVDGAGLAS